MIKKFIICLICFCLFSGPLFADIYLQDSAVTPQKVEAAFSRLSADSSYKSKTSPVLRNMTITLLAAMVIYYTFYDDYNGFSEDDDLTRLLEERNPIKEYSPETNAAAAKTLNRNAAGKSRLARIFKKMTRSEVFILAAVGVETVLSFFERESRHKESASLRRAEIERLLKQTAEQTPEKFTLTAYLISERKTVCSIIAETPSFYELLDKQINFAVSEENKKFTAALRKASENLSVKEDVNLLKRELKTIGADLNKNQNYLSAEGFLF